jgi:diguanylate cyclase (GGDEF)-like protein
MLRKPLAFIVLANFILVIANQVTGWYYTIDAANIYYRGPYYFVSVFWTISLVIAAFIMILKNRDKVENLTGVYNRKWLDFAINNRISKSNARSSFAAILIDLDDFKIINDTYGHDVGDKVLQDITKVLKNCLSSEALLARYGGDEFYILLNSGDPEVVRETIEQLQSCMKIYNKTNEQGFKISISVGSIVYDPSSNWSVLDFEKKVDELLYLNKRNKKSSKG